MRPAAALMAPETPPRCLYADEARPGRGNADASGSEAAQPAAERPADTAAVSRRERERDCYRDAEHRVRAKLTSLQASVRRTLQEVEASSAVMP
jgi:hypothetical protein